MNSLPSELISHIMQYLSVSDRKEAALTCKAWYNASLHPDLQKDIRVKCRPLEGGCLPPTGLVSRKLTHLEFGDWDSQQVSEGTFIFLLSKCSSLIELDLSSCNKLFLSGSLLQKNDDRNLLKQILVNVLVLKLGCLRFMTDITFTRLVSVMENLEHISLASTNMIFGSGLYDVNQSSPAMLHFSAFLKFVQERSEKLKIIDLSYTAVHNEALDALGKIKGLALQEIYLQGCTEITDKGLKMLVANQQSLELINISGCRELGNSQTFFSSLAINLPQLHTLVMRKCVKMGQCDISSLSNFKALHTLDLGEVINLLDKDLIKGICCQGPRLISLSLPFCPDVHDEFIFQLCKSNCTLTNLDLSSCLKLTDSGLHAITKSLTSLRSLRLPHCREISDIGILGYVPKDGVVPSITFDFDHVGCPCTRERDSKVFRKPSGSVKEHHSCLSKTHACMKNGEKLHMLSNLKALQILDLSSCPRITDFALTEAIRFNELRVLRLNSISKIKDSAIVSIARCNPSLEEVYLQANANITDAAFCELLKHCPRLSTLDVSQCSMLTNKCLEFLAIQKTRLHHLDISFNNMLMSAVARLESQCPKLKIAFRPHIC